MDTHDFIARYGGVYEHSPWVAELAAPIAASVADRQRLAELMADWSVVEVTARQSFSPRNGMFPSP